MLRCRLDLYHLCNLFTMIEWDLFTKDVKSIDTSHSYDKLKQYMHK